MKQITLQVGTAVAPDGSVYVGGPMVVSVYPPPSPTGAPVQSALPAVMDYVFVAPTDLPAGTKLRIANWDRYPFIQGGVRYNHAVAQVGYDPSVAPDVFWLLHPMKAGEYLMIIPCVLTDGIHTISLV